MSEILERIGHLQGVQSVGASSMIPLARGGWDDRPGAGWSNQRFTVKHRMAAAQTTPNADPRVVTPDYFRALGVPLRSGRAFIPGRSPGCRAGAHRQRDLRATLLPPYPQENPVGQRLVLGFGVDIQIDARIKQPAWRQIVGVVGDVRSAGLHAEPRPEM